MSANAMTLSDLGEAVAGRLVFMPDCIGNRRVGGLAVEGGEVPPGAHNERLHVTGAEELDITSNRGHRSIGVKVFDRSREDHVVSVGTVSVLALREVIRPTAIVRRVTARIVDAIDTQLVVIAIGKRPFDEGFEIGPFRADRQTLVDVARVVFAAVVHHPPNLRQTGTTQTVRQALTLTPSTTGAAARLRHTVFEIALQWLRHLPAIALGRVMDILRTTVDARFDHSKFADTITDFIDWGRVSLLLLISHVSLSFRSIGLHDC